MKIETEDLEYCKVKVSYEADLDAVKAKEREALIALRKLPIPGFRPGKAPDYAIKARAKKQLNNWIAREMSAQAFDDVLFDTKIKPIGYPKYDNIKLDNGQFSCELTIMKKPNFGLEEYKGLEIPRPAMDRDAEAQMEATLQDLRTRLGDVLPYQEGDFVEIGDQITMDFSGTIEGEPFDGSTEEGALYTVGDKKWPEFDESILGMMPGDDREFSVTIPDGVPNIGGKTVNFKVHVHMGTKRVPCALNDELAQKVGLQTFDEVKDKIRVVVADRIKNTENYLVRQQVANRLVDAHDFEVPNWLALMEAQSLTAQDNINWNLLSDDNREPYLKKAKRNVKLSLILDSIREQEPETILSDTEAVESLKSQMLSRGVDGEKFVVENQRSGRLLGIVTAMKDEFTLQWVVDQAKVIDA